MKITYSILERYIEGSLDGESKKIIEAFLEHNSDGLEYLHISNDIEKALYKQDELELQRLLIDVLKQNRIRSSRKITPLKNRFKYLGGIAALIILVFATLHILLINSNVNTGKHIYNKYYSYNNLILISRDVDTNCLSNDLTRLIQNNQFVEAVQLSEKILLGDSSNLYIRLLLSISLMETNRYHEAIIHLEKIERQNDILYSGTASWHLALVLILIEDFEPAIKKLQKISLSGGIYANDSGEILKILCSRGYQLACNLSDK